MHVVQLLSDPIDQPCVSSLRLLRESFELSIHPALGLVGKAGEAQVATNVGLHLHLATGGARAQEAGTRHEGILCALELVEELAGHLEVALGGAELLDFDAAEAQVHPVKNRCEEERLGVRLHHGDQLLHEVLVQGELVPLEGLPELHLQGSEAELRVATETLLEVAPASAHHGHEHVAALFVVKHDRQFVVGDFESLRSC